MPNGPESTGAGVAERRTAVVHRAARTQAERLAGFLEGKGFACRVQPASDGAASGLEAALRTASPAAEEAFGMPVVGGLLRFRFKKEMGSAGKVELQALSAALGPHDVLVAPEDLERALDVAKPYVRTLDAGGGYAGSEPVPGGGAEATVDARTATAIDAVPVANVPWHEAWELSGRLTDAGIPATVMMPEGVEPGPLTERAVPVGVKPSDAERARRFIEDEGRAEPRA